MKLTSLAVLLALAIPVFAQDTPKPYHPGPVWQVQFIRAKAGMEDRYLRYLASDWKNEQEAMKKNGFILDYKVVTTEAHGPQDFNVILMSEFKDLATLEANQDKMEASALQLLGGRQKVESGYEDRANYREVVAGRLGREIILEPKK
ncbi:MAG TPA: hypothetical protein VKT29_07150 [Terriglobales bacterium]|nr:hypothetical protein [Terriglobales bacterium]